MREIKFRAWDTYSKKMIDWSACCKSEVLTLSNLLNSLIPHLIPMQYTGLKDKNSVEIHEGDVVAYKRGEQGKESFYDAKEVVRFQGGSFVIGSASMSDWHSSEGNLRERLSSWYDNIWRTQHFERDFDIEVIGNIYEHPSLLK